MRFTVLYLMVELARRGIKVSTRVALKEPHFRIFLECANQEQKVEHIRRVARWAIFKACERSPRPRVRQNFEHYVTTPTPGVRDLVRLRH